MASSATIEEDLKLPCKKKLYEQWQENNDSKIMFGEHELKIELFDIDEQFIQKAKEELRETPEIFAESCAELKKLIAGKTRSIYKNTSFCYRDFEMRGTNTIIV